MAYTELSGDGIELLELRQQMNRAATARFKVSSEFGDSTGMATRSVVRYTAPGGRVLFSGRVLPAARVIGSSDDAIEYVAADVLEWLGNNPCAEVNRYYNRSRADTSLFAYPSDYTIRQIIEAELASITGAGQLLGSLNWAAVPTDVQELVIYDFDTKGKTWLGLLDAVAAQVPVLGWFYDPAGATLVGDGEGGGVLRFYDVSSYYGTAQPAYLPRRDEASGAAAFNIESISLSVDISQSFDTLSFYGWGSMQERYEKATPGWDTADAGEVYTGTGTPRILRPAANTADVCEEFTPGFLPGQEGTWAVVDFTLSSRPYHPDSPRIEDRKAYRVWQVNYEIVDFRMVKDTTVVPNRAMSVTPTMWAEGAYYTFYAGSVVFRISGTTYTGGLSAAGEYPIKWATFTNGATDEITLTTIDDWGNVLPNVDLYPGGITATGAPRVNLGGPEAFESNLFSMPKPLISHTAYQWFNVATGAENYTGMTNDGTPYNYLAHVYWAQGNDIWFHYTSRADLVATITNPGLGYDKHQVLYDTRFLKYTNEAGTVLRDDTAMLVAYATMLFALISRPHITGTMAVHVDPDTIDTLFPMGGGVVVQNWQDSTAYTVPSPIQSRTLTRLDQWTLELGFDTARTFTSLDLTKKFRQFFRQNDLTGSIGGFQGSNGGSGGPGGTGTGGGGVGGGGGTGTGGTGGGSGGGGGGIGGGGSGGLPGGWPGGTGSGTGPGGSQTGGGTPFDPGGGGGPGSGGDGSSGSGSGGA